MICDVVVLCTKCFFCLIFIPDLFQCPENFFKCPRHFCIDTRFVCDGIRQCLRGEDEQNCGKLEVYEPARRLSGKSAINCIWNQNISCSSPIMVQHLVRKF